jgi:hypothetical protein
MSGETHPIHYAASQGLLEIDLHIREIAPVEQLAVFHHLADDAIIPRLIDRDGGGNSAIAHID